MLLACTCLLTAACVSKPPPPPTFEAQTAFIVPGRTQRPEVAAKLGMPLPGSVNGRVVFYTIPEVYGEYIGVQYDASGVVVDTRRHQFSW
jgi:hypothetical protein